MANELEDRVAWIHALATELTTEDMVTLKANLRQLARQAGDAADAVTEELRRQRPRRHHMGTEKTLDSADSRLLERGNDCAAAEPLKGIGMAPRNRLS